MNQETINAKAQVVEEVVKKFQENSVIIVVGLQGLDSVATTTIRRNLHAAETSLSVVKNNVLKRASEKCNYAELDPFFTGSTAVALSNNVSGATKALTEFAKTNDKLVIKGGIVDGKFVTVKEIEALSKLPDKNGMLSMLLSCLQSPISSFARVVKAIADKQQEGSAE